MSNSQHCINCLRESTVLYEYPCVSCNWSPEQYSKSGLYLSPGTILHGQYQIGKLLGHGGFGITYLAWDNLLEIKLAIKEYMPRDFATRNSTNSEISAFAGDAKANFTYGLERFLEEARTLAKFQQHNGIVSVLNVFYGNGTGYMVMEYVDGFTLKEYLIQKEKLSWGQTLKVFMPVMDALREVHKYGMLHRDISPDNIYLCRDNRVKLLDFGSARYSLGGHSRSLSVVVKPGYAPEEQYRTKGNQGPWTDVYSVAASMYRCITGLVPPDALDRLDEDELKTPSMLGINIPDKAERELMAALAIKSNQRTQSIEAFQKGFLDISDSVGKTKEYQDKEKSTEKPYSYSKYETVDKSNNGGWFIFGLAIVILLIYGIVNNESPKPVKEVKETKVVKTETSLQTNKPTITHSNEKVIDTSEQFNLAKRYFDSKNYPKAFEIFIRLANDGDTYSQNLIGWMYLNGMGVVKNEKESIKWLTLSANKGFAAAQNNLGFLYSNARGTTRDYAKSFDWHKKAADQGDAIGQYNIGVMYFQGLGVKADYQEAFDFFKKAAGQGLKDAQFNLGVMYERGQGVVKANDKEAINWYMLSANQGLNVAQYNLGFMYEQGKGVSQDNKEAIRWYQLAANQGYPEAKIALNRVKATINQKEQESIDPSEQVKLASKYYLDKKYKLAVQLYQSAAEKGNTVAQYNLAVMYEKGLGATQDYKQSFYWYEKVSNQGDASAQSKLGTLYAKGLGIKKDFTMAVRLYQLAADQGLAQAQNNLGVMYLNGYGVDKDKYMAIKWFDLAAKQGDKEAIKVLKELQQEDL